MVKAGDVVVVDYPGVSGSKTRPAIVVSSDLYNSERPDIILGLVTSQLHQAKDSTDYILEDWKKAGLHSRSAFRAFLSTIPASQATIIGRLSDRDWQEIQLKLKLAIAF